MTIEHLKSAKIIFWDFDGVIKDSVEVKSAVFGQLFLPFGKIVAKKVVYFGFSIGIFFTLFFSTNFSDLISVRIAIGSGTAFIIAQLLDVKIFDQLKKQLLHLLN